MNYKKLLYAWVFMMSCVCFNVCYADDSQSTTDICEAEADRAELNYLFILSGMHHREDEKFWGATNYSDFGLKFAVSLNDFVLENDLSYGKSFSFSGPIVSSCTNVFLAQRALNNKKDDDEAAKYSKDLFLGTVKDNVFEKPHLRRSLTRVSYNNTQKDYKVVLGDSGAFCTFGNMIGLSGAGISIVRTSSMFDGKASAVLNSQSCIVLTRESTVEILQNGCSIQTDIYAPGAYSIDSFCPECKLHDIEVSVTDSFNRGYTYKVDVYGDQKPMKGNTDEFEFRLFFPNIYDPLDVYRVKYSGNLVGSGVYRYGVSDDLTVQVGIQGHKSGVKAEAGAIKETKIGILSSSIGVSSKGTISAQAFYETPDSKFGKLQIFGNFVEKGHPDLGRGEENDAIHRSIFNKFLKATYGDVYTSQFVDSSSKRLNVRYIPIKLFDLISVSFAVDNVWQDKYSKRSYDVSFSGTFFEKYSFAFGLGLTYNRDTRDYVGEYYPKSDELVRRMYAAVVLPITSEVELSSTYDYDDDRSTYSCLSYKPNAVKGLRVDLDTTIFGGCGNYRTHGGKIKYEFTGGDIRFDHNIKMRQSTKLHKNRERIFGNIYVKNNKFSKKIKTSNFIHLTKEDLKDKK